jgi:hypothetical protein
MARLLVLIALVVALVAPAGALAQSSPFSPLPPAQQATPEPTPAPTTAADQQDVSRGLLLGIAGAVLVVFVGIGVFITRDARRNLTDADRRAVERGERGERPEDDRRSTEAARKKARAAGKRQRQARKAQRRR